MAAPGATLRSCRTRPASSFPKHDRRPSGHPSRALERVEVGQAGRDGGPSGALDAGDLRAASRGSGSTLHGVVFDVLYPSACHLAQAHRCCRGSSASHGWRLIVDSKRCQPGCRRHVRRATYVWVRLRGRLGRLSGGERSGYGLPWPAANRAFNALLWGSAKGAVRLQGKARGGRSARERALLRRISA